jgi:hypothetical protein
MLSPDHRTPADAYSSSNPAPLLAPLTPILISDLPSLLPRERQGHWIRQGTHTHTHTCTHMQRWPAHGCYFAHVVHAMQTHVYNFAHTHLQTHDTLHQHALYHAADALPLLPYLHLLPSLPLLLSSLICCTPPVMLPLLPALCSALRCDALALLPSLCCPRTAVLPSLCRPRTAVLPSLCCAVLLLCSPSSTLSSHSRASSHAIPLLSRHQAPPQIQILAPEHTQTLNKKNPTAHGTPHAHYSPHTYKARL